MIGMTSIFSFQQKSPRTRKSSGFRNLLWEFKFTEIDLKVSQITQDDNINPLHKEGFENFRVGLEEFLIENEVIYDKNFGYFKVYLSTSVELTDIIQTSENYYGKEWFSDVIVSSEDSDWYEKVLISFLIFIIIKFMFSSYITLLTEFNFLGISIIGIFY